MPDQGWKEGGMRVKRARILGRILDRFSLIEMFSGCAIDRLPTSWPDITPTQLELVFNTHSEQSVIRPTFAEGLMR
jgi:hypothetical protein